MTTGPAPITGKDWKDLIEPRIMAADLRAIETAIKAVQDAAGGGGGTGIELVSGTVTLDSSGTPIREFYCTDAATIAGVSLAAGTVAVFKRTPQGVWQYKVADHWASTVPVPDDPDPDPSDITPPTWDATFTMGTPTTGGIIATASILAADDVAVVGYEVSYNGGSTWAAIVPDGVDFALSGTQGATYSDTLLRAKDAGGNYSTPLSVPAYTLATAGGTYDVAFRGLTGTASTDAVQPFTLASAVAIGTPSQSRTVIVALSSRSTSSSGSWLACTIGGVPATLHAGTTSANAAAIFSAVVPAGETADIVAQWNQKDLTSAHAAVWTVDGTLVPAGAAAAAARTVTCPTVADGFAFGMGWEGSSDATVSTSWPVDINEPNGQSGRNLAVHDATSGGDTTFTWSASGGHMSNYTTTLATFGRTS